VRTEKIDLKNCGPREPNGQNELCSVGEGEEGTTGLGENAVFIGSKCCLQSPLFPLGP
jgi:hypothetical protein